MDLHNFGAIRAVAGRLDMLGIPYAFVGGSIVNLLLDFPELSPARPTDDVDVILELAANVRYSDLEARLRVAGFSHDVRTGAPKCRWLLEGMVVDIMPTDGAGIGLNTKWFREALASAEARVFAHTTVPVVSPVAFLALKFSAFCDRGLGDLYGSRDVEDFMAVVDGREAIAEEVNRAECTLRSYVIDAVRNFRSRPAFSDALPGYLSRDDAVRVRLLDEKLSRIAALA